MKDILTSPRMEDMKRKRRIARVRLSILVFILFITIIGASSYFSSSPRFLINKVVVTGPRIINTPDVEANVKNTISGKYLKLFTRANAFIYPKNKIHKNLTDTFHRIEKLSVYRDDLHTLHIDISERSGTSLYCGDKVPELSVDVGENCYFVNDDGYIFDKAPYFSGNIYFKYYVILPKTDENPLGQQMLTPERFHIVARFIDAISDLGFEPNYLIMNTDGENTLYLSHNQGDTSPTIIFKDSDDLSSILGNLSISMAKPEFANEINSKYTTLLYIDLRFKNKVLYKFK